MERREFLKAGTAAGLMSSARVLEPLAQAEQPKNNLAPIPKRALGKTGEKLSIICFAGIVVMENSPSFASNIVAEAVDRGINYFDVAPTYGNAQERLGLALQPYRDKVFLACKEEDWSKEGSAKLLDALGSPDLSLAGAEFAKHTLPRPVAELAPLYPKR